MAAETVAFNLEDEGIADAKTEVIPNFDPNAALKEAEADQPAESSPSNVPQVPPAVYRAVC